jgi:Ala-tRNA(Pro) deacylase
VPGKALAKVVIVKADDRIVMLALPASYRVHEAKLAAALEARDVRIAREDEFRDAFPDCEVGAMPPFGNCTECQSWSTGYSPRTTRSSSRRALRPTH